MCNVIEILLNVDTIIYNLVSVTKTVENRQIIVQSQSLLLNSPTIRYYLSENRALDFAEQF